MEILRNVLIIYGVLCIVIGLLKPPFIWNMKKFKVMKKMMGANGLRIFVLVWGALAIAIGLLI
ncbi:hypothetical protein RJG79_07770 [Mycoplasmatota bacterium WC44]